ncbi:lysophospholipid acyltransferase family protein [Comamonas granuli]|uniref:lysophospholipid acyltransferase family protein n=1 Tax=Comamonas granuli TaxID=290309 RepID=UPI000A06F468|nr:lysophospholipid acyltransferase family protein [Comamonas granuli]
MPVRRLVACWRVLRMAVHLLCGHATVMWRFPRLSAAARAAYVQGWALALLRHGGMRVVVQGRPQVRGPVVWVANHISWLDIPVLHAIGYCRFVSKSSVQRWPLIGAAATAMGTLYIERSSRRDALRTVRAMQAALAQGDVLAVFPEGTTGDGRRLLPFHANLLQAAVQAQVAVQPLGLRFVHRRTGQACYYPSYKGEGSVWRSVWRTLSCEALDAVVSFGPPEMARGRERRVWAQDLHATVDALRHAGAADAAGLTEPAGKTHPAPAPGPQTPGQSAAG